MPHVTLPVVTRVTFGLAQLCPKKSKTACHVSLPGDAMCHRPESQYHPYGPATCRLYEHSMSVYGHATSASVWTVRTAQSANFLPI
jgi:hypothetical protein